MDDTALGGHGDKFEAFVKRLREGFPYQKWRVKSGEFCGAWHSQDDDFLKNFRSIWLFDPLRNHRRPRPVCVFRKSPAAAGRVCETSEQM